MAIDDGLHSFDLYSIGEEGCLLIWPSVLEDHYSIFKENEGKKGSNPRQTGMGPIDVWHHVFPDSVQFRGWV